MSRPAFLKPTESYPTRSFLSLWLHPSPWSSPPGLFAFLEHTRQLQAQGLWTHCTLSLVCPFPHRCLLNLFSSSKSLLRPLHLIFL